MLLTLVSFFFVFTIITLAHEFGHLLFSKRAGIRVHEFGLGFGPTLYSTRRNLTTYKINLLPILGYVKIAGVDTDDPEEKSTPENEKYYTKSALQRFNSIFAGPFFNLVLGFLVFTAVFMFSGIPTGVTNEISAISPGSEAVRIGLKPGDRLIAINKLKHENPEDAVKVIHQSPDKELVLTIEREKKLININAIPKLNKQAKIGLIGFSLKVNYKRSGPLEAIYYGAKETAGLIIMMLAILGKLMLGRLALSDLAGPVGIAQITGQYAHHGLISLLSFIGFFSVNVAVINLLPLPALDGGRLFFILLELVRRKPISIDKENMVHQVGMYVLLGLLAVLTVNDLLRLLQH